MDTVPFNSILFVVDVVLLWSLAHWGNKRLWFVAVLIDLFMVKGVSVLFRHGYGQNIVEGVCFHFGLFLIISGLILYLRKFRITGVVSVVLGLPFPVLGIYCMFYEPYAITLEHYKIVSPKVEKPIRVVFVSDTQTNTISNYELKVFRLMNSQEADIILFGGDYLQFFGKAGDMETLRKRFNGALTAEKFEAPLGIYAIQGNNDDAKRLQELFKDTEIQLINKTQTIDLGPVVLTLLSLGDSGLSPYGKWPRPKIFLKTEEERAKFHLMVGHSPTYITGPTDADLMLAGHTHGGQIIIPFYGPIATGVHKLPFPRKWAVGMHPGTDKHPDGSHFIVTRGTGMERGWAPEVRFLCKPEISVIDIVPK
ncbi:MAG: metallophosphoesterase [Planctomycetaceae bacterium]|nr:metallophosphoesterase [Planctomycetaceae bacterium]